MVETFNAQVVTLHVRVSNKAAIHLYRHTLGFKTEKTEAKYYADGEDAFCMRLDLGYLREQMQDAALETKADAGAAEALDEGEPAGDVGKAGDLPERNKDAMVKVKVGRGLGVGELVERDESKHS
jgi:hypothetical protein